MKYLYHAVKQVKQRSTWIFEPRKVMNVRVARFDRPYRIVHDFRALIQEGDDGDDGMPFVRSMETSFLTKNAPYSTQSIS